MSAITAGARIASVVAGLLRVIGPAGLVGAERAKPAADSVV